MLSVLSPCFTHTNVYFGKKKYRMFLLLFIKWFLCIFHDVSHFYTILNLTSSFVFDGWKSITTFGMFLLLLVCPLGQRSLTLWIGSIRSERPEVEFLQWGQRQQQKLFLPDWGLVGTSMWILLLSSLPVLGR